VASCWNKEVFCYEFDPNSNSVNPITVNSSHEGPVLTCCWSDDGKTVFSGGCDNKGVMWDLEKNTSNVVAQHDGAIKFIKWIPELKVLMTGGWDKKIKYWDLKSNNPAMTIDIPDKFYCGDQLEDLAVIGTAGRKIVIYNLAQPGEPYATINSPLKFQSRCISCFPDKTGFALGSIEGRVAITNITDNSKSFIFKCHRKEKPSRIYSVNEIVFHPTLGSFATCGSDGTFNFWDKENRERLRSFKECYLPIVTCAYSPSGIFSYSIGYDWSNGAEGYNQQEMKNHIYIYSPPQNEVTPKGQFNKY